MVLIISRLRGRLQITVQKRHIRLNLVDMKDLFFFFVS